jgi:hypothetical protein
MSKERKAPAVRSGAGGVRNGYAASGSATAYYEEQGSRYTNPHEGAIKAMLVRALPKSHFSHVRCVRWGGLQVHERSAPRNTCQILEEHWHCCLYELCSETMFDLQFACIYITHVVGNMLVVADFGLERASSTHARTHTHTHMHTPVLTSSYCVHSRACVRTC